MIDDVGVGLAFAHARYLDTKAHSFLSVDPLLYSIPQSYLYDPQQMNSYAYARNNPIIYNDPTGMSVSSFFSSVGNAISNVANDAINKAKDVISSISSLVKPANSSVSASPTKTSATPTNSSKAIGGGQSSVGPVLSANAWSTQYPDMEGCLQTCVSMSGYKPVGQIDTQRLGSSGGLVATSDARKGIETIDNYLADGVAPIVGVNRGHGGTNTDNNNHATEHFVSITSSGYLNGRRYYTFFDPGTQWRENGASSNNLLFLNEENYTLSGKTMYNDSFDYTVTEVKMK